VMRESDTRPPDDGADDETDRPVEGRVAVLEDQLARARETLDSVSVDRERLHRALSRGRIPVGDRDVPVQRALTSEEREALDWLVEQRRKAQRAQGGGA
jgi:hypothetical protein